MGYYSIIFCDGIFISDKYQDKINYLTDIVHHPEIATQEELALCKSFVDLINTIHTKQIDSELKEILVEVCTSAERFRSRQEVVFTELFYPFDPGGELILDDYNGKHYSDNTLVFLLASVTDKNIEENVEILFEGSDNSYWGYLISSDGKGKVSIHNMNREWCVSDLLTEVNDVHAQN